MISKDVSLLFGLGILFCLVGVGCLSFDPPDPMLQAEGLSLIGLSLLIIREGIQELP
jgi:hypothetical protein